jgi:hypothetical protein
MTQNPRIEFLIVQYFSARYFSSSFFCDLIFSSSDMLATIVDSIVLLSNAKDCFDQKALNKNGRDESELVKVAAIA